MIELLEYLDERGRSPFDLWREGLDAISRARVERATTRLAEGNFSALKGVGEGLLEMRLDFGLGFRIYLARDGDVFVILLGGGTKRRQDADIQAAKDRWQDYKRRKRIHEATDAQALRDHPARPAVKRRLSPRLPR